MTFLAPRADRGGRLIGLLVCRFLVVDGCSFGSSEPGALEMDWLEVQLEIYRSRGMQVCFFLFMYKNEFELTCGVGIIGLVEWTCAAERWKLFSRLCSFVPFFFECEQRKD